MSDKYITDAFMNGERERLEQWLNEKPAAKAQEPKPGQPQKPEEKGSRNPLQMAADFIYPAQPGQERNVLATAGEKVAETFAEGVNQVKRGFSGESKPAATPGALASSAVDWAQGGAGEIPEAGRSKALGVVRDVAMGSLNVVFPFSSAAGYLVSEIKARVKAVATKAR